MSSILTFGVHSYRTSRKPSHAYFSSLNEVGEVSVQLQPPPPKRSIKTKSLFDSLSPLFKWTGGKRREIKLFEKFFPEFVKEKDSSYTYVEPFAGGAAVYWYLNNVDGKNIINDFDDQVINFYEQFKISSSRFVSQLRAIGEISDHNKLQDIYYEYRNKDKKDGLLSISETDQAIRFFVVNQLAFSGMRRFNAKGEFNVPFGHYKGINTDIIGSPKHKKLLEATKISKKDFEPIMNGNDTENTFQFIDPPYTRVFKEYSSNNSFGEKHHRQLAETIKGLKKASVMMIIDKSSLTQELYKGLITSSYPLNYGVNIKNRFSTAVEHLIIRNY